MQQQQQQQQYQIPSQSNGITQNDIDLARLQNLQVLNALRLLQQSQLSALQTPRQNINLNQMLQNYSANQIRNWQIQQPQTTNNDANLDRIAKFHRSSAGIYILILSIMCFNYLFS